MESHLPLPMRPGSPTKVQRYFQDLEKGKLMGTKCPRCKGLYCPPRADCPNCQGSQMEWVELGGKGKLRTYTFLYVTPESFSQYAPYAVGIVQLDEGPSVMAQIVDVQPSDLAVGMRLQAVFSKGIEGRPTLKFKPFPTE